MITLNGEKHTNYRMLSGGRFLPEKHERVTVRYVGQVNGRDFAGEVKAVINNTEDEIVLSRGYNTVCNGRAQTISLMPGELIIKTWSGDAYQFSGYRVYKTGYQIPESQSLTVPNIRRGNRT